ncbi:WD40/YVTN/BNR-like repeat-containing protein [Paucihalobacter sp.]|uniref:WD40/YVTN/BNR-like repeat-containing protein n=1 Tax=Paucihalobacter sp. TaxID=2850405 RepID=UPI002FE1174B
MRLLLIFLLGITILSCKKDKTTDFKIFTEVTITPILTDSLLSVRAIDILDDGNLVFAANNGRFGMYNAANEQWQIGTKNYDFLNLQFRAVAHTATDFFMLSIENPALLFKTGDTGSMELVYKEEHPNVFYDAMMFWNNTEGIAIGDPTDNCLSIIITRDSGNTWNKLECEKLPKIKDGEAAFAASNTNIAIVNEHTWIATSGTASRVWHSPDKGNTWQVYDTPILQGTATTGIYSIDFFDENNGFAIGGDYTKPNDSIANKIRTIDGGKTWQVMANGSAPGYRSCVQYIPNGKAKALVAAGFKGISYSNDSGESWSQLSDEGFYTIRFINDSTAFAAGKGRIAKLKFK